MLRKWTVMLLLATPMWWACQREKLPYFGEPDMVKKMVDGREVEQKDYPVIPAFSFTNQNVQPVTVQDKRWVQDGKYWTSAGVTAGMDMSLALINNIRGEQYTKAAMLDLEYDPQPPFQAGSEQNTDKAIVDMMRGMYDAGLVSAKKAPIPVAVQPAIIPTAPLKAGKKASIKAHSKTAFVARPAKLAPAGLLTESADPVCQILVAKGTTLMATHKGHQYGFCSELCKDRFVKNPAQYVTK